MSAPIKNAEQTATAAAQKPGIFRRTGAYMKAHGVDLMIGAAIGLTAAAAAVAVSRHNEQWYLKMLRG
jgi:hypothetical protein